MHSEFLRIISRKPEYAKNVCIDRNKPFYFVCRRWITLTNTSGNVKTDYSFKVVLVNLSVNVSESIIFK